jgi:hypothetical protein
MVEPAGGGREKREGRGEYGWSTLYAHMKRT